LVTLLLCGACNSSAPKGAQPSAAAKALSPADELKLGQVPKADPREARLAGGLLALLEQEHVRPHPIDDTIAKQAFATFIEHLDPEKLLLLKPEVAILERDATRMDDQLREGDFQLARLGTELVAERRVKVSKLVAELLLTPFDFKAEESIESDPKKREFPANEAELEDRWKKTLKLQVLERIARMEELQKAREKAAEKKDDAKAEGKPEKEDKLDPSPSEKNDPIPASFEGREKKAREDLAKSYVGRFTRLAKREPLEAAEAFINSFTGVFDPHTAYLAPAQQENFDIEISGSLEGIGAVLSEEDQYILVRELVPGGAAWRQGDLEAGDLILSVKQNGGEPVDVGGMRINDVVRMIRGPKGTIVTLQVKKPDQRLLTIAITRDVVVVEASYARGATLDLGPKHEPVGYVYLPGFYGNTRAAKGQTPERNATDDVRALLERFTANKVSSVILDLRGNGGGLLNHATGITGLFVDQGPVVQARGSKDRMQVLGDDEPGVTFAGEVVVLVDRFSASASEILAGALKDYHRALIVGAGPTHGKGTVQAIVDLDRRLGGTQAAPLGIVKLTIQQFFLIDGESTQWQGVSPDVMLPDPASHIESREQYLEHAIPWSKVAPLPATLWMHGPWTVEGLAAQSGTRSALVPAFNKIKARGDFLVNRRKQTVVPLSEQAWNALRKQDRDALEELDPKLDEGTPRFSVQIVEYRPHVDVPQGTRPAPSTRIDRWSETLAHDPWVEEALFLAADMTATALPTPKAKSINGGAR